MLTFTTCVKSSGFLSPPSLILSLRRVDPCLEFNSSKESHSTVIAVGHINLNRLHVVEAIGWWPQEGHKGHNSKHLLSGWHFWLQWCLCNLVGILLDIYTTLSDCSYLMNLSLTNWYMGLPERMTQKCHITICPLHKDGKFEISFVINLWSHIKIFCLFLEESIRELARIILMHQRRFF